MDDESGVKTRVDEGRATQHIAEKVRSWETTLCAL
jgi:hypothetical protein